MPINFDFNNDGVLNASDLSAYMEYIAQDGYVTDEEFENFSQMMNELGIGNPDSYVAWQDFINASSGFESEEAFFASFTPTNQGELGISAGASGNIGELQRMLQSYTGRTSLIQSPQRQKAIFTIDRFDGGINLNKSPRDLAYWEACQMDELTPSKVGRLIRLGDFTSESTYAMELAGAEQENYGLHYFKWSNSVNDGGTLDDGSPSNYLAYTSGDGGVDLWNFSDSGGADEVSSVIADSLFDNAYKPVYHSAANRLYVSDANLSTTSSKDKSRVCGIVDRPSYYPFIHTDGSLKYGISAGSTQDDADANSILIASQPLYQAAPVAGIEDAGNVCVTSSSSGFANSGTTHNGIYINAQFANITDESPGIGWGGIGTASPDNVKYYKFFASFLYDDGSETKLTDVTGHDNTHNDIEAIPNVEVVTATTGTNSEYQKLVVKQILIDAPAFYGTAALERVHGARFYYAETNSAGNLTGDDKYLWAELDFRYGFKLISEFGNWNLFMNEDADGTTPTAAELQSLQVLNAADTDGNTTPDGTLSINSPPTAFTYYSLNLFHQEELKSDLMWKTSTIGNGIAFVGNVKYDGRQYPDTMLYSGAGETDSGSAYPMWGTFPVDSNRIEIPGDGGEITALKWTKNRVLQFRKNALYIINVEDVLAPRIDGNYQGMGISGQYAVTATPYGVAWVNDTGAYAYNAEEGRVRSLTLGRLDAEDFGADSNSKIGYDDRAKMLIIGNYTLRGTDGYHYAYSFVTDAWCTWNTNANNDTAISNFAIDHDGYLTGGTRSSGNIVVNKWKAQAQTASVVDYITKDIDMGKPNLDKRFYTLYISYTGGGSQSNMYVYFRANGLKGSELTNGWTQLQTIQDYTDPYGSTNSTAWGGSSGSPTTGDTTIGTADDLDSTDQVASVSGKFEQKLAKINLRNLVASSGSVDDTVVDFTSDADRTALPVDYLKFARSIQFRIKGTAATTFEINDISLVFKEKRIK